MHEELYRTSYLGNSVGDTICFRYLLKERSSDGVVVANYASSDPLRSGALVYCPDDIGGNTFSLWLGSNCKLTRNEARAVWKHLVDDGWSIKESSDDGISN